MRNNNSIDHFPAWRKNLYRLIFEAETRSSRAFDIVLLVAIFLSVMAVILESVAHIKESFGIHLRTIEWFFTILFTIEYLLRMISTPHPVRYFFSFFGLIDLVSIIPTYLSLINGDMQSLLIIRGMRLLRIFRILKLGRYLFEAELLVESLKSSRRKIIVFLGTVVISVLIMGAIMYLIEGAENGFTSIPRGIYWAIVTMTTVGYGDLAPKTALGQGLATIIMVLGYSVIAVPSGIVTAELSKAQGARANTRLCSNCSLEGHHIDANFCRACGEKLLEKIQS